MDKLFFFDRVEGIEISYQSLYRDLSKSIIFKRYCRNSSIYEIFQSLILSLCYGEEIILLDNDLSHDELKNLLGHSFIDLNQEIEKSRINVPNYKSLLKLIDLNKNKWRITIFTSGTSGQPKSITHTYESLTRNVVIGNNKLDNVWGYAFNPTHMAGLQVFFQAFLNYNSIIRIFGLDRRVIISLINDFRITNISATPTFYKLLMPADFECNSVKNVTFGGEKFKENVAVSLRKVFPQAKFRNVYASTEAGAIFTALDSNLKVPLKISHLVKVIDAELLLHKSLIGISENLSLQGDWYKTGDLVEVIQENPLIIKFVERRSNLINTGGYKVNPAEIEECIMLMPEVNDVYVYGKSNSLLGNVVVCDIIVNLDVNGSEFTEIKVLNFCKQRLQDFKIPRIFNFVDKFEINRTGKLKKK
jgi:acyl-coenzyme A synthetase/AMP-(fatty) acid ligase